MDNINLKTEKLRSDLYAIANQSQLPIANVYFVYKDVYKDLEKLYNDVINKEITKMREEQKQDQGKEEEEVD